jgi:hypothetical protein
MLLGLPAEAQCTKNHIARWLSTDIIYIIEGDFHEVQSQPIISYEKHTDHGILREQSRDFMNKGGILFYGFQSVVTAGSDNYQSRFKDYRVL